jgi:hypothetical protein
MTPATMVDLRLETLGWDPRTLNMPVQIPRSGNLCVLAYDYNDKEKAFIGGYAEVAKQMCEAGWSVDIAPPKILIIQEKTNDGYHREKGPADSSGHL